MVPKIYADIGRRIRELREAAGISQEKLGQALGGRTQGSIAQLEQGQRKIDLDTLTQIGDFFGAPLESFIKDGWRVSRQKGRPVLIIDGLDLQQAFDQYLADTPFEALRSTEEVRLKALTHVEGCSVAMLELAEDERVYYSYAPEPREWHYLERRIASCGGAFRSMADVIHALKTLRHSGILDKNK